jgi:hypothetical protein
MRVKSGNEPALCNNSASGQKPVDLLKSYNSKQSEHSFYDEVRPAVSFSAVVRQAGTAFSPGRRDKNCR